jgi:hypothetical protein
MAMETILINIDSQGVRQAKLNGRDYLVAPVTMLVQGVLPGSAGSLYYPPDEIEHNYDSWNGVPLTGGHPVIGGENVSARKPEVLNEYWLGNVYNVCYHGPGDYPQDGRPSPRGDLAKLAGEAWFDIERTDEFDRKLAPNQKVLPRLRAGHAIEVSTGLFTDNHPVENGSTFNQVPYTHVARNYRPDHLAVLVEQKGACSVGDGCGVNVNQSTRDLIVSNAISEYKAMQTKDQLIGYLTTNCACYKNKHKQLKEFTENELVELKRQAVAGKVAALAGKGWTANQLVANADGDGDTAPKGVNIADLADFLGVGIDPKTDPVGFVKELQSKLSGVMDQLGGATGSAPAAPEPDADNMPSPPEGNMGPGSIGPASAIPNDYTGYDMGRGKNIPNEPKGGSTTNVKSFTEHLQKYGTPEEVRVWNNAIQMDRQNRISLIERIIANADNKAKPHLRQIYSGMDLKQLTLIANSQGTGNGPSNNGRGTVLQPAPLYAPANGPAGISQVHNAADNDYDDSDVMPRITIHDVE